VRRAAAATTAQVLSAIDGAGWSTLLLTEPFALIVRCFSALRLDDGPLTVYDLERLRRGPRQLVLSSCDSGLSRRSAPTRCSLASSLIPLGTAAILASVVPVNDAAVVPLMIPFTGSYAVAQASRKLCVTPAANANQTRWARPPGGPSFALERADVGGFSSRRALLTN
jgi:hypothetical protein